MSYCRWSDGDCYVYRDVSRMQAPNEDRPNQNVRPFVQSLPKEAYPDFEEIEDEMILTEAELILFQDSNPADTVVYEVTHVRF